MWKFVWMIYQIFNHVEMLKPNLLICFLPRKNFWLPFFLLLHFLNLPALFLFFPMIIDLPTTDVEKIKSKLSAYDVAFVAIRDVPGPDGSAQSAAVAAYFSCTTITNNSFLVELKFKTGMNLCKVTVKSANKSLSDSCKVTVVKLLMAA